MFCTKPSSAFVIKLFFLCLESRGREFKKKKEYMYIYMLIYIYKTDGSVTLADSERWRSRDSERAGARAGFFFSQFL